MSQGPRAPSANPLRKAAFREEARTIVQNDRYERKRGATVDTVGTIARALERAYRRGFAEGQTSAPTLPIAQDEAGSVAWTLIGFRPRSAFYSLCFSMFGNTTLFPYRPAADRPGHFQQDTTVRGTTGWRLVVDGRSDEGVVASRTIQPLIRQGLLETDPTAPDRLRITPCGRATWERFVAGGGRFPHDVPE